VSPNSLSYFIIFGCLSLLVSGCGGDAPKPSNSASPSPAASAIVPAPSVTTATALAASPAASLIASTGEAKDSVAQPTFSGDIAAGLIPASDTETVTKSVAKGRVDPFSAVIAQPVIQRVVVPAGNRITSQPTTPPAVAFNSGVKSGSNGGATNNNLGSNVGVASIADMVSKKSTKSNEKSVTAPKITVPKTIANKTTASKTITSKTVAVSSIPVVTPLVPIKTALLTPPAAKPAIVPELAPAIQVSGVSVINGQTQVIVKLPGESFSRYLSVGENVLNGKVLIKRVQDPTAITPIVVLEEAGIEVLRRVGEKPMIANKEAAASLETPK
jgi:hypothetical protein